MPNLQKITSWFFVSLFLLGQLGAQEKERYLLGDEQKLEMIVHVFGEVTRSGEYRVADDTNVLELISKAGGPTEFSKLSSVRLTRVQPLLQSSNRNGIDNSNGSFNSNYKLGERVIKINLDKYLKEGKGSLLTLQPGDVVFVPRNKWFRWRNVVAVARDLSVIASVYLIYIRAKND